MLLPAWPASRPVPLFAAGAVVCAAIIMSAGLALAVFNNAKSVGSSAFTTTSLAAPTGLGAAGGTNIVLTWTATTSTFATGYNVLRSSTSGGPYTQIAQVTPSTATTYTDSPLLGTYFYFFGGLFKKV